MSDEPVKLAEFFLVEGKLGQGSFGQVLLARDERTGGQVAIKTERDDAEFPQLEFESRVLAELEGVHGVPRVYWFGTEHDTHYLIMTRLGHSLETLRLREPGHVLPMGVTCRFGAEVIAILKRVHELGFVHRDIKPDNLVMGTRAMKHSVYLIDFGLAKKVRLPNGKHIPTYTRSGLVGTIRFASLHNHAGMALSFRDDIETLVYVLIFLVRGELPWQNIGVEGHKARADAVWAEKARIPPEHLCKDLPACFLNTLKLARGLKYEQAPDYVAVEAWWREVATA